jgi:pheromone shutdown protein TraB
VKSEIESFAKYLPSLSEVIIRERDEYLSQTVLELVRLAYGPRYTEGHSLREGKVVVVIGAGHLVGIQEFFRRGMSSEERMRVISSSSKHNATWPGTGFLQVVDTKILFPVIPQGPRK